MSETNGSVRAGVLERHKLRREPLAGTIWGDGLFIRMLRGDELSKRRTLFKSIAGQGQEISDEDFMAATVILALCDETGAAVFAPEDREALLAGPLAPLDAAFRLALKVNGWSDEANREIEKNSETSRT